MSQLPLAKYNDKRETGKVSIEYILAMDIIYSYLCIFIVNIYMRGFYKSNRIKMNIPIKNG